MHEACSNCCVSAEGHNSEMSENVKAPKNSQLLRERKGKGEEKGGEVRQKTAICCDGCVYCCCCRQYMIFFFRSKGTDTGQWSTAGCKGV